MVELVDVKYFWESHPLWTGESMHSAGSKEFYDEHRAIYISDCFAGNFDIRFLPPPRTSGQEMKILDLGCGIGFWACEFGMRGLSHVEAADLTKKALDLTEKRLKLFGVKAKLSRQNAESLNYPDAVFDHVNCQGVIHHTPNTDMAIAEIARVLKSEGTASISVYYKNPILKLWPCVRWFGWILGKLGAGLSGRGREDIFLEKDVDEIVRMYDGSDNPLGKSYSRHDFCALLEKHFCIQETYLHFFPARSLPFRLPSRLHQWLDKNLGFMIYATVEKKCVV